MGKDMKPVGRVGRASGPVVGAVLALLLSGCASSPDSGAASSAPTPRSSATESPKATATATRAPVAGSEFGPHGVRVSSAKLTAKTLKIALVGPEDATFRLRSSNKSTHVVCRGQKDSLDARAAKGLPPNSIQHYTVTCGQLSYDKTPTLLTMVDLEEGASYEFENPVTVTS
jgi:hypothetical protein